MSTPAAIIATLRQYKGNTLELAMYAEALTAGASRRQLCRQIIKTLTCLTQPLSKCTPAAVAEAIEQEDRPP